MVLAALAPLFSNAGIVKAVADQGIKFSKKQSLELFNYDFIGLLQKIVIFYILAWLVEQYLRARLFFDNLSPLQSSGITFGGIGGLIITTFAQRMQQQSVPQINNDFLKQLMTDGYDTNGFKIKYWDIINTIALIMVLAEWWQYYELNEKNGGKLSYTTHAIFALFGILLGFVGLPKIYQGFKTLQFNREELR